MNGLRGKRHKRGKARRRRTYRAYRAFRAPLRKLVKGPRGMGFPTSGCHVYGVYRVGRSTEGMAGQATERPDHNREASGTGAS